MAAPPAAAPASAACPPHPGFMGGICIRCGALRDEAEEKGVALSYIHRGLEVSKHEAERLRQGTAERLLAQKKLLLILDLDHTLLNSTRFSEIPPESEAALRAQLEAQPGDSPMLYHLPFMRMWTKLRPGVRQFLEAAKDKFELHVYTMGDRHYAGEMAKLLDPTGKIFHGRVISSGDSTQRYVKDLDVVLGRERVVLILDDTEGVWPRHRENLVAPERYLYFPADAARFGFKGQSLFERGVDEASAEGSLATCLRVMSRVQEQFFEQADHHAADVRPLLGGVRRGILAGTTLLFSRVWPMDCPDPSAHILWLLATKLGAQVTTNPGAGVTHVVATDVTDKARWANAQGKHVVSPGWLWCCAYTWQHVNESRFPVKPGSSAAAAVAAAAGRSEAEDVARALAAAGGGEAGQPAGQQQAGQQQQPAQQQQQEDVVKAAAA
ncbi:RNA polymerase II C-terminal domain phosphatase-like 4 [Micractinium conductrix]|uniref:RNA polymerase II C-terminal domain phosphatase-like n=1 Tax=Micractinium conductrix TaxID=554055 RepID=A0A2P6VDX7_9CHLO|nr:RNA polymerase II C-terminal domain phosphatase-like 4 [Micractinium conductrix]|eukprot:PSC72296.1 RNA polymerase II C-terminal domain phosphatase-like 4 [Micractinium conductrix]